MRTEALTIVHPPFICNTHETVAHRRRATRTRFTVGGYAPRPQWPTPRGKCIPDLVSV